jgi:hypothetical protein
VSSDVGSAVAAAAVAAAVTLRSRRHLAAAFGPKRLFLRTGL